MPNDTIRVGPACSADMHVVHPVYGTCVDCGVQIRPSLADRVNHLETEVALLKATIRKLREALDDE